LSVFFVYSLFCSSHNIAFSEPRVHAMVYEPGSGCLVKLPVDFKDQLSELGTIYDLYKIENSTSVNPVK
jgi:hypothetical protein